MGIVILLIILISVVEFIGDANLKFFARNGLKYDHLLYGSIAYIFVVLLLIYTLKFTNVIYINGMWDGISAIVESVLAIILLKEKLSNKYQYLGLGLIISGIFLLNTGKIPY